MKSASVAMMKSRRRSCPQRMVPKEGSQLRALYDVLMENKGKAVNVKDILPSNNHRRQQFIHRLRQNYELDIRLCGHFNYSLVGEWVGVAYIDYLAEHHNGKDD